MQNDMARMLTELQVLRAHLVGPLLILLKAALVAIFLQHRHSE